MAAFFVSTVKIKNKEKFQQYAKQAAETFATHGGEPVLRGQFDTVLAGEDDHDMVGIVRFPDRNALSSWYDSDEYQALIPLRDEAAEMTLVVYSEPL